MQIRGNKTPRTVKRIFHHHLCIRSPPQKNNSCNQFMKGTNVVMLIMDEKGWAVIDSPKVYVYHMYDMERRWMGSSRQRTLQRAVPYRLEGAAGCTCRSRLGVARRGEMQSSLQYALKAVPVAAVICFESHAGFPA
jgi:hypothetical protein